MRAVGGPARASGFAFVLLSATMFGSTPALVTLAYRGGVPELTLITVRCLGGAILIWLFTRHIRKTTLPTRTRVACWLLGALAFGPQMVCFFASLHHLDTSVAIAIAFLYPALVTGAATVRSRVVPATGEMVLVGLAVGGVAVVTLSDGVDRVASIGVLLAVAAAVGYSAFVVGADALLPEVGGPALTVHVLSGAAASAGVIALLTGGFAMPADAGGMGVLALHALIVVPVGFLAYTAGLRRLGPMNASVVDTMQPVVATVVAAAFLDEPIGPVRLAGIAVVVGSLSWLVARRPAEPEWKSAAPSST